MSAFIHAAAARLGLLFSNPFVSIAILASVIAVTATILFWRTDK